MSQSSPQHIQTYTPRRFDPTVRKLDVKVVQHGDGRATTWRRKRSRRYDSLGNYFDILVKPLIVSAAIMGAVVVWFFLVRTIWRLSLFERFLGLYRGRDGTE